MSIFLVSAPARRFGFRRWAPIAAAVTACWAGACSKVVPVELSVVEPCDQQQQALNGASSYAISTAGSALDDVVTFAAGEDVPALAVGLGEVSVTVKAFAADVTAGGAASAVPQAVGRTPPLAITERTGEVQAIVPVGLLDSFGRTTDAAGACSSMTVGAPVPGRHAHTATYVPGLNQVLLYGGAVFAEDGSERVLATAELFDPLTGTFTSLEAPGGRAYHAATALPDGRVLISGGFAVISGALSAVQTAEVFDPSTSSFRTITLRQARAHHTSTLMAGAGVVALVGGCVGSGAADGCTPSAAGAGNLGASTSLATTIETLDVDDPDAVTQAVLPSSGLLVGRAFHQATSLENGPSTLLVVTGGANADGPVDSVEVFRAAGGVLARVEGVSLAPFPEGKAPVRHTAVALDAQSLLVIGGFTHADDGAPSGEPSAEIFMFTTSSGINPTPFGTLFEQHGRAGHRTAMLADGSILVVGGVAADGAPNAEVLARAAGTGVLTPRVLARSPVQARDHAELTLLPSNQVLATGGHNTTPPFVTSNVAELYFGP